MDEHEKVKITKIKKKPIIFVGLLILVVILIVFCYKGLLPLNCCKKDSQTSESDFYAIKLDHNDGSGDITELKVKEGSKYGKLPNLVREGFMFVGWYTEQGVKIYSDTIVKKEDIGNLKAKWKNEGEFEVSLELNDGILDFATIKVKNGEPYGKLPTPTKENAEFDGWYTLEGEKITEETIVDLDENEKIYAKWKEEYTVTFNCGEDECLIKTKKVTTHEPYGELPILKKDKYTFLGWYTNEKDGERIDESAIVSIKEDITLYARWTKEVTYTVTFDANGGECNTKTIELINNVKYGTLPVPIRSEYKFDGWYTEKNGGKKITASSIFNESKSITLYAKWIEVTYRVTFDSNGGSTIKDVLVVKNGNTYGELPTPTRKNYDFLGWYTTKLSGTKIISTTKVNLTKDIILYARWEGKSYKITLDPNYSGASSVTKTIKNGENYSNGTIKRDGYDFDGWYTTKAGAVKVNDGTIIDTDSDVTLYAKWIPGSYKLYLDLNYVGGSVSEVKVTNGDAYLLTNPTRAGYTFDGWYTEKIAGEKITSGMIVNIIKDTTLFARWIDNDPNNFTCYVLDASGTITNYYSNRNNDSNYPSCPRNVEIPSVINGTTVTKIGNNAFQGKLITSIILPNSLKEIGNYAFATNRITTVNIPSGTEVISEWAFSGNQITTLTLPATVNKIGESAFRDNNLISISIPLNVSTIGKEAFFNNSLTSVNLADGIKIIENRAFYQNNLSSITIPNSVNTIKQEAFSNNKLTSVTIIGKSNKSEFSVYESSIWGWLDNTYNDDNITWLK